MTNTEYNIITDSLLTNITQIIKQYINDDYHSIVYNTDNIPRNRKISNTEWIDSIDSLIQNEIKPLVNDIVEYTKKLYNN